MNFEKLLPAIIVVIIFTMFFARPAFAQVVDPSSWQTGATGLATATNPNKSTAGLTTTLNTTQGWPFLGLFGGVSIGGSGNLTQGPGIDLGLLSIPGQTGSFTSESPDWTHNTLNFNSGALNATISRLSPATLIQSSASTLRFFSGNLNTYTFNGTTVTGPTIAQVHPKYVAYSSGGSVRVQALSTTAFNFPALDQNWILVWYGNNSYMVDTKKILTYSHDTPNGWTGGLPQRYAFQADAPILLVFQNNPTSIVQTSSGGIDLTFASTAGSLSWLPLYGQNHLVAATTDAWSQGTSNASFAQAVTQAQWWANRLCSFPQTAAETYNYSSISDTSTITETITYTQVCSTPGTTFAPVPPMLGIAKDILPVTFSGTVVNSNTPTQFGPILGIEHTNTYNWSLAGLKKYTDNQRVITNTGTAPPDVLQDLNNQVNAVTTAGHLAPWIFNDNESRARISAGDIYWMNPADTLYQLSEVVPALSDPQKTNLINYLKSERSNYPPETTYNLSLSQGTVRGSYAIQPLSSTITSLQNNRSELFLKKVPLWNFFALSRYYDVTGDTLNSSVEQSGLTALNNAMSQQDWATMYWFQGYDDVLTSIVNAHRHFAGLIGLIRLAEKTGDQTNEYLTRSLLAKATALEIGMIHYPRYLYTVDLQELPTDSGANWQVLFNAGFWEGHIFDYNFATSNDDPSQMAQLNQFQSMLYEGSNFKISPTWDNGFNSPYLIAYRDLTPELARFQSDYDSSEATIMYNKATSFLPRWYEAFTEGVLGEEHNLNAPIDSYQLFMAGAWLKGLSATQLESYLDIPWLSSGDIFYIHKLAETVKAFEGISWQGANLGPTPTPSGITPTNTPVPTLTPPTSTDTPTPTSLLTLTPTPTPTPTQSGPTNSPTPTSIPPTATPTKIISSGDLNNDGKTDLTDLSILLSDFNTSQPFDLDTDNIINSVDFSVMLNILKTNGVIQ